MVKDLMAQAYGAMRYNRRRTALTMLGMAWGIATVVLLLAYGAGFGRAIETIFANWGTRIIGVFPGRTSQQAGGQKWPQRRATPFRCKGEGGRVADSSRSLTGAHVRDREDRRQAVPRGAGSDPARRAPARGRGRERRARAADVPV